MKRKHGSASGKRGEARPITEAELQQAIAHFLGEGHHITKLPPGPEPRTRIVGGHYGPYENITDTGG